MHILKKIFLLTVILTIYANIANASDYSYGFLNKQENNYLNSKKSIKVYLKKDWATANKNEFSQIFDFLTNYLKLYQKILRKKIIFVKNLTINKNNDIFKNKHIDLIATLGKNQNKNKQYLYGNNRVFDLFYAFAIAIDKKNPSFNEINKKGERLAVVKGFAKINYIKKMYPNIKLIECSSNYDALKFVLQKKAAYAFGNYFIFKYLIYKNFLSGLRIKLQNKDKNLTCTPEYLAFDKNNKILKDIFNKAYTQIDKEEIYLLQSKWLPLPTARKIFLTKKEKKFIKNHILSINITTTWMPFNFEDKNGKIAGIGIDYWKLIAKKVHLKYKFFKAKTFTEVLKNIKIKKYDLNIATSKTFDKESFALFTKTYEKFPIAIATKKINNFITTGVNLENKKVAVGKSYSTYFLLKSMYPKIDFILTKDTKEALYLVENGTAFAAVDIEPSLRYQIIKNNFNDIYITGITGIDFNLQIMARDDYAILISILNKSINSISNQERIKIYKKWMGVKKEQINYMLIAKITFFFFFALFILLYFYIRQKRLKKEVERLNKTLKKRIKIAIQKEKKQQLATLQQSRLAQMGEVISMIAHQWKQPLNALIFLNSTIIVKYKNNTITKEVMDQFEQRSGKIISQMAQTIDNFRNFFKPEKEKKIFSLSSTIFESIEILRPLLKKQDINLNINLSKDIKIFGYKNEFGQAILNIINNSIDAFLERNIKDKKITITQFVKNHITTIIIKENAGGIKKEVLPHIFEPYFTTKEKNGGDGIGLYMTKLIIEQHMNGSIYIDNIKNGIEIKIILGVVQDENNANR